MSKRKEKFIILETMHPNDEMYEKTNNREMIPLSWIEKAYIDKRDSDYAVVCVCVHDPCRDPHGAVIGTPVPTGRGHQTFYLNAGRFCDEEESLREIKRAGAANTALTNLCSLLNDS